MRIIYYVLLHTPYKQYNVLTFIEPACGQSNKNYSAYLLVCYYFESHK